MISTLILLLIIRIILILILIHHHFLKEIIIIIIMISKQVFSAIAALRFIKYLYTKFLYLFGLATNNPAFSESVWRSVNGHHQHQKT